MYRNDHEESSQPRTMTVQCTFAGGGGGGSYKVHRALMS